MRQFLQGRPLASIAIVILVLLLAAGAGLAIAWSRGDTLLPDLLSNLGIGDRERVAGADTTSVIGQDTGGLALPTKAPSDARWAFVLLGYGGKGHDGGYLTDSIMVTIVDPTQKTMTMLSIPRDSWVPLAFDGQTAVYNKVNTAYAFATDSSLYKNRLPRYSGKNGAGTFTKDTLSRILGIPITNYLAMDFAGFRDMINTMGGIDVAVPDSFTALYPANDNSSVDPSWITVKFNKGTEHMNGERAIEFARAREVIDNASESNDFARSRRQRLIMEAFKSRLFQAGGMIHLPQLIAIAAQHVDTDYAVPDILQFGQFLTQWKDTTVYECALTGSNYLEESTGPSGTYVLVPTTSDRSWQQIRAFARQLWQNPALGVQMAATRVVVSNDTGKAGVGGQLTNVLEKLGYLVGSPVTGSLRATSSIIDGTAGSGTLVARQLGQDLLSSFPIVSDASGGVNQIVIELGSDDIAVADISVPTDNEAPLSSDGLQEAGTWLPASDTVTPLIVMPSATRSSLPSATPSHGPLFASTPFSTTVAAISPTLYPSSLPKASPSATRSPTTAATPTASPSSTSTALPTNTPHPLGPTPTKTPG